MRILVTGAGGFIGRRLVAFLAHNNCRVFALSRSEKIGHHPLLVDSVNAESLARVLDGIELDAVVNLAAAGVRPDERNMEVLTRVNTLLPCEVLAAASRCGARVFLQAGTSAEYAPSLNYAPLTEQSEIVWDKSYGATKVAASMLLPLWGHEYDVRVATLRLFNVFGPGEAAHRLFPSLVGRLARGEPVPMSAGTQVRDFLHVDDVCRAMLAMLRVMQLDAAVCGVFNLSSGVDMSVAQFAKRVAQAVGAPDDLLSLGALPLRPDDLPYVVGDPTRVKSVSGWRPEYGATEAIDIAVAEMLRAA